MSDKDFVEEYTVTDEEGYEFTGYRPSKDYTVPTITAEEFLEALESVVKGKEDFVYDSSHGCKYQRGDAPSCVIGHVFAEKYPDTFEAVADWETISDDGNIGSFYDSEFFNADAKTLNAMSVAQYVQDGGKTWGEALAAAKEILGR